MTKVVIIIAILIVSAVGVYYLLGSKASPIVPTSYSSTSSAQPSASSTDQSLEDEVNSISLSTDESSDLDLIAVDEDIKGL